MFPHVMSKAERGDAVVPGLISHFWFSGDPQYGQQNSFEFGAMF